MTLVIKNIGQSKRNERKKERMTSPIKNLFKGKSG